MNKNNKNKYIDKEEFVSLIREYFRLSHEMEKEDLDDIELKKIKKSLDKHYNEIGKCFILIAENFARRFNFYLYTYLDEMISDGILRCVEAFKGKRFEKNFEERGNPFRLFLSCYF